MKRTFPCGCEIDYNVIVMCPEHNKKGFIAKPNFWTKKLEMEDL